MSILAYHWINFLVLATVLVLFARKKLSQVFMTERESLKVEMDSSAARFRQIKSEFDELESKVKNLPAELEKMKRIGKDELNREIEKIRNEQRVSLDRVARDADLRIKADLEKLKLQIEKEIFDFSIQTAQEEMRKDKQFQKDWSSQVLDQESESVRRNYAS